MKHGVELRPVDSAMRFPPKFLSYQWASRLLFLVLVACALPHHVRAQPLEENAVDDSAAALAEKQTSLKAILLSIDQLQTDLESKQQLLRSPDCRGREEEVTGEIKKIAVSLEQLRRNFNQIATEVDPESFAEQRKGETLVWDTELRDLLGPLLNEVKRLTSRPRELDRFRSQIAEYEEQLQLARKASAKLDRLISISKDAKLLTNLTEVRQDWERQESSIKTQLSIVTQKLDLKLSERKSLGESLNDITNLFFRSRGRNLLLALLATSVFWLVVRRIHAGIQRWRPLQKRGSSFQLRLFNVIFLFLTGFGAILVFLLMLFFFGDWVLLILGIMFLLGLIWTSKHAVPLLWNQSTILLNMGTVREGERVLLSGLPWRVQSLNYYTTLVNPVLEGGLLRLPIRDLPELRSRAFGSHEPWFPTLRGDWVLLADSTFGQVESQTPESVVVILSGGSQKTYPSEEYLKQSPINLSSGFRVNVPFSLANSVQSTLLTEVIPGLEDALREELPEVGYSISLKSVKVEFTEASSSSLTVSIIADFTGEAAPDYESLQRKLQSICLSTSIANSWQLPYDEMMVEITKGTLAA